ncbi:MAG: S8 family serine peptidase [Armatimonadota bacterium]|nr:S8 family serine peptidase [bacterium]
MEPRVRRSKRILLTGITFLMLMSLWLTAAVVASADTGNVQYVPNEYIIHVQPGTSYSTVEQLVSRMGAGIVRVLPVDNTYQIRLTGSYARTPTRFATSSQPVKWVIDHIQPNYMNYPCAVPNDTYWDKLWGMRMINMPAAWDTAKGNSDIIVAVNDTGVAPHPDLGDRLLDGYDCVDDDSDPMPVNSGEGSSHGTHVAGTIAAQGNNGMGVVGVCWDNVKILPVRVLGPLGGTTDMIVRGLDYAMLNGADVVNMSYGNYYDDSIEHAKIQELNDAGIILVGAAGNDSTSYSHFPSNWAEVIAVSALGPYEDIAYYSNYGKIEIAAPGGDLSLGDDGGIYSTIINWDAEGKTSYNYESYQGTSMAAPHVSGAAALLMSAGVPASQVRSQLISTARAPSGLMLDTTTYGAGILDVAASLSSASLRIQQPVKGSSVRSTPEFKIAIKGIETSTLKVYLDYPDTNEDGIPDNLDDDTYVILDSTNVNSYLNTNRTAVAFTWPLVNTDSPLGAGSHEVYATAESKADGSNVYDWAQFTVASVTFSAGIHLVAFPYQFTSTASSNLVSVFPETLLQTSNGLPVNFSSAGSTKARLFRWLPKTSTTRTIPYYTYPQDWLAWSNPQDWMPDSLDPTTRYYWYTGGGYYTEGTTNIYSYPAGTGFWLVLQQDAVVNDSFNTEHYLTPTDNAFNIYLYQGWNMIGNPYNRETSWWNALFSYKGQVKSFADAVTAGWVSPAVYSYSTTPTPGYKIVNKQELLQPYHGYWLKTYVGGVKSTDSLVMTIF